MKMPNQSWNEYLAKGVRLMEGTEPAFEGKRRLPEANRIFEECVNQTDDETVQVLSHFRYVQSALYQSDPARAKQWLEKAQSAFKKAEYPKNIAPQCLVIEGRALMHFGQYGQAERVLLLAYRHGQKGTDHKLNGDIANMLGRLYSQHRELTQDNPEQVAADWFTTAVEEFTAVPEPNADTYHALAAASGRAGTALQKAHGYTSPAAQKMLKQAERLFSTEVHDPCVQVTFWIERRKVALKYWRIDHVVIFFVKSIFPAFACVWQLQRK